MANLEPHFIVTMLNEIISNHTLAGININPFSSVIVCSGKTTASPVFNAIQRHIALAALAYSLLRAAQHDSDLHIKLQRQLKIILDSIAGFLLGNAQGITIIQWNIFIISMQSERIVIGEIENTARELKPHL